MLSSGDFLSGIEWAPFRPSSKFEFYIDADVDDHEKLATLTRQLRAWRLRDGDSCLVSLSLVSVPVPIDERAVAALELLPPWKGTLYMKGCKWPEQPSERESLVQRMTSTQHLGD